MFINHTNFTDTNTLHNSDIDVQLCNYIKLYVP